jgi:uncharacterized radical SAM superfamily protein
MANLIDMGIIETAIIEIITTEIMEIDKEGYEVFLLPKKGHQKNDYPLWKQHLEHENKNFQPKIGVNVAIVE